MFIFVLFIFCTYLVDKQDYLFCNPSICHPFIVRPPSAPLYSVGSDMSPSTDGIYNVDSKTKTNQTEINARQLI